MSIGSGILPKFLFSAHPSFSLSSLLIWSTSVFLSVLIFSNSLQRPSVKRGGNQSYDFHSCCFFLRSKVLDPVTWNCMQIDSPSPSLLYHPPPVDRANIDLHDSTLSHFPSPRRADSKSSRRMGDRCARSPLPKRYIQWEKWTKVHLVGKRTKGTNNLPYHIWENDRKFHIHNCWQGTRGPRVPKQRYRQHCKARPKTTRTWKYGGLSVSLIQLCMTLQGSLCHNQVQPKSNEKDIFRTHACLLLTPPLSTCKVCWHHHYPPARVWWPFGTRWVNSVDKRVVTSGSSRGKLFLSLTIRCGRRKSPCRWPYVCRRIGTQFDGKCERESQEVKRMGPLTGKKNLVFLWSQQTKWNLQRQHMQA